MTSNLFDKIKFPMKQTTVRANVTSNDISHIKQINFDNLQHFNFKVILAFVLQLFQLPLISNTFWHLCCNYFSSLSSQRNTCSSYAFISQAERVEISINESCHFHFHFHSILLLLLFLKRHLFTFIFALVQNDNWLLVSADSEKKSFLQLMIVYFQCGWIDYKNSLECL